MTGTNEGIAAKGTGQLMKLSERKGSDLVQQVLAQMIRLWYDITPKERDRLHGQQEAAKACLQELMNRCIEQEDTRP